MTVERVGVSFEPVLLAKFDRLIKRNGYGSRSEAIMDVVRKAVLESELSVGSGEVIGTITIVYDHHAGGVTDRLLHLQHHHHSGIISTVHVHVTEDTCLEVIVVRGNAAEVRELSDKIKATKGVKHGELVVTKADI